jgi:ribosomal protein S18 acetylase RimI-like enzyme
MSAEADAQDPHAIRPARKGDLLVAAAALTDAFGDDPLFRWFMRQDHMYEPMRARFFASLLSGLGLNGGTVSISADGAGAALWIPAPGPKPQPILDELRLLPLLLGCTSFSRFGRLLELRAAMDRAKEKQPNAYLWFLGVRTDRQGKGYGSRLLDATLAPLDRAGTIATLDTATPANLPLYRSRGFQITREYRPGKDGPVIWAMRRHPRPF